MIDFDAYLRRIGLDPADKPAWQAVHRAHVTTIPFENLDPHRGIPVSLEQADLERKLVASRRGGYCFEHNLLLASALAHMGLEVEPMLARARVGGAPRETRPATHLVLRVTGAGRQWQADVGFGLGTLLDPIPFGPAGIHEQSGWSFQVVEDGDELTLQTLGTNGWADVYSFPPRPAFRIDIEVSNWWTCTNPASPFVRGLIVAVSHDDGRREALHDFSGPLLALASSPDGTETAEVQRSAIPALLAQRFGLPGFALGPDGRVVGLASIGGYLAACDGADHGAHEERGQQRGEGEGRAGRALLEQPGQFLAEGEPGTTKQPRAIGKGAARGRPGRSALGGRG